MRLIPCLLLFALVALSSCSRGYVIVCNCAEFSGTQKVDSATISISTRTNNSPQARCEEEFRARFVNTGNTFDCVVYPSE